MSEILTQYGLVVVFGIILLPVYVMVAGWFLGEPRDLRVPTLAFGYLVGFTVLIMLGLAVLAGITSIVVPA